MTTRSGRFPGRRRAPAVSSSSNPAMVPSPELTPKIHPILKPPLAAWAPMALRSTTFDRLLGKHGNTARKPSRAARRDLALVSPKSRQMMAARQRASDASSFSKDCAAAFSRSTHRGSSKGDEASSRRRASTDAEIPAPASPTPQTATHGTGPATASPSAGSTPNAPVGAAASNICPTLAASVAPFEAASCTISPSNATKAFCSSSNVVATSWERLSRPASPSSAARHKTTLGRASRRGAPHLCGKHAALRGRSRPRRRSGAERREALTSKAAATGREAHSSLVPRPTRRGASTWAGLRCTSAPGPREEHAATGLPRDGAARAPARL
mmetsp:Transcript_71072/g.197428  ORF Transcript_71072/g.197428 Transcript_71072/m.197428 type:complete len:327 (+) Transcript_71072:718-1698(+)